jgi:hypothetical protein
VKLGKGAEPCFYDLGNHDDVFSSLRRPFPRQMGVAKYFSSQICSTAIVSLLERLEGTAQRMCFPRIRNQHRDFLS